MIKLLRSKISGIMSHLYGRKEANAYKISPGWTLNAGKLYKVKENVCFSVCLYDGKECLYKDEIDYLNTNTKDIYYIRGGEILLYLRDVRVSENSSNENKIYMRPLFLKGDRIYIPLRPHLIGHYQHYNAKEKIARFEEVMEQL